MEACDDALECFLHVRDMMISCLQSEMNITRSYLKFISGGGGRGGGGVMDKHLSIYKKKLEDLDETVRRLRCN
jgi:hypothetical protein